MCEQCASLFILNNSAIHRKYYPKDSCNSSVAMNGYIRAYTLRELKKLMTFFCMNKIHLGVKLIFLITLKANEANQLHFNMCVHVKFVIVKWVSFQSKQKI